MARVDIPEYNAWLKAVLAEKLVEKPEMEAVERTAAEYELTYSVLIERSLVVLSVMYPYANEVLSGGSLSLLKKLFSGLPIDYEQFLPMGPRTPSLVLKVHCALLGEDQEQRQRCVYLLSRLRCWLLIGPLVVRLRWLQGATLRADAAARRAPDGEAALAATSAVGYPMPPLRLQVRRDETCWITCKPDRVNLIVTVEIDREDDLTLARNFCQCFQEANGSLPYTFHAHPAVPPDLLEVYDLPEAPFSVGFMTAALTDHAVRGLTEEKLLEMAQKAMTYRNYFKLHMNLMKLSMYTTEMARIKTLQGKYDEARLELRGPQEG